MNTEGPREGSLVGREPDSDRRAEPAGQEPGRLADAPNNRSTPRSAPTGEALTDEQEREAFEAWAMREGVDTTPWLHHTPKAGWLNGRTADYWTGWLARAALATHPPAVQPVAPAARDVLAERQRQISAEGWTPEHDDEHRTGAMAAAAACYALHAVAESAGTSYGRIGRQEAAQRMWPWDFEWWKPSLGNPRRDLIKAGALILAEIERLVYDPQAYKAKEKIIAICRAEQQRQLARFDREMAKLAAKDAA